MNEEKKVKYGEIYFYDFGEHEEKRIRQSTNTVKNGC